MTIYTGSLTALASESPTIQTKNGDVLFVGATGTATATVVLQVKPRLDSAWVAKQTICTSVATTSATRTTIPVIWDEPYARLVVTAYTSGTVVYRLEQDLSAKTDDTFWESVQIPASSIILCGNAADAGRESDETKFPGSLLFDTTTSELVAGITAIPHGWKVGTPIRPKLHWTKTTSAANGVVWGLSYRILNVGAAPGAWSDVTNGTHETSISNTADVEMIDSFGEIALTGTLTAPHIAWIVTRVTGDAADTYAADARLLSVDFDYQRNAHGSNLELVANA
jgi:hypothetical protein